MQAVIDFLNFSRILLKRPSWLGRSRQESELRLIIKQSILESNSPIFNSVENVVVHSVE